MNTEKETEENLEFAFGDNFLKHHAGQIITDQRFAIIELVANSWDAGAAKVEIKWPINSDRIFEIKDNGIGMTYNEFRQRWCTLNYNRLDEQGREVTFPNNVKKNRRMAFGRNGIGRHAMFCFSDTYEIITQKDGELTHAKVTLESGSKPFDIKFH
jgi:HSP90 family molecular chaperone